MEEEPRGSGTVESVRLRQEQPAKVRGPGRSPDGPDSRTARPDVWRSSWPRRDTSGTTSLRAEQGERGHVSATRPERARDGGRDCSWCSRYCRIACKARYVRARREVYRTDRSYGG